MTPSSSSIECNLWSIHQNISTCWGKNQKEKRKIPRLIVVSKMQSHEAIQVAYDAGERFFGENYVQELISKSQKLPNDIFWHLIGHVQTNKVNFLLKNLSPPRLSMVETIDSVKIADAFQNGMQKNCENSPKLNVLIEVNTSAEDSKSGINCELFDEIVGLVSHILQNCNLLNFCGFMTIAHPEPEKARLCFSKLREIKIQVESLFDLSNLELSMGMSGDMEIAIEEGYQENV
jgi:pyridoxal phosphate enzyme (YggS family)